VTIVLTNQAQGTLDIILTGNDRGSAGLCSTGLQTGGGGSDANHHFEMSSTSLAEGGLYQGPSHSGVCRVAQTRSANPPGPNPPKTCTSVAVPPFLLGKLTMIS
jgi:hypothetical protein